MNHRDFRLSLEREDQDSWLTLERKKAFQQEYLGSNVIKSGCINRNGDMYSEESINRMYDEWRDKVSKRLFSMGTNIGACLMGDL